MTTDRTVTDLMVAVKQLEAIAKRVTEFKRRDTEQVGPDGYGSGRSNETGRSASGDHSDPTSNAATGRRQRDDVHEWTVGLLDAVRVACDAANQAAGFVHLIDSLVDQRTGHVNLVEQCPVCDAPMPEPRAGMSQDCYRRWVRAGRPERAPWINAERRRLAAPEEYVA